jgi:hypothetical protein
MRVAVTEQNIIEYGLDKLTGNTKDELLAAAARAAEFNQVLHVKIPDVEGGDTEAPTERNTFEHYSDMPEPDGRSHEQDSVDLASIGDRRSEFTEVDTVTNRIKAGMAPFDPKEITVFYQNDGGYLATGIRVTVRVESLPLASASFVIDRNDLVEEDAGEMLEALGQKFFNFFRNMREELEGSVDLERD